MDTAACGKGHSTNQTSRHAVDAKFLQIRLQILPVKDHRKQIMQQPWNTNADNGNYCGKDNSVYPNELNGKQVDSKIRHGGYERAEAILMPHSCGVLIGIEQLIIHPREKVYYQADDCGERQHQTLSNPQFHKRLIQA